VTLKAQASDADGDAIEFLWMLGTDSGTLSATSGQQVQWRCQAGRAALP